MVKLSDVADIEMADNAEEMYAKINGNDGILLSLQKQSNASTAAVSHALQKAMDKLTEEGDGLHILALSDQGTYIDIVINSVLQNLLMGGALAVLILLLFLRDVKPTAIIAVSIPVSLLFAVAMMYFSGVTMNVISLAGLALGVGMLVDNSIVVIENIYRAACAGSTGRCGGGQGRIPGGGRHHRFHPHHYLRLSSHCVHRGNLPAAFYRYGSYHRVFPDRQPDHRHDPGAHAGLPDPAQGGG